VEGGLAGNTSPQTDEVQTAGPRKPLKREALRKTAQGGKTVTKGATNKVKQTGKSAPIVVDESDYEVAPTKR